MIFFIVLKKHSGSVEKNGCVVGLEPREPRRQLEQQRVQRVRFQPEQQQPEQPEQQPWFPCVPNSFYCFWAGFTVIPKKILKDQTSSGL